MLKKITIGDLGTIVTGKTPPTTNKSYYGDYAVFIKPTDIEDDTKYTYETDEMYSEVAAEKYKASLVPKDAICVPCIGTVGTKMTMTPCACFTNQSINSIVCNDKYDSHYVYYLIRNFLPNFKLYNLGTASGREYISKTNFEKIEIFAEQDKGMQKRIASILSAYDDLIEVNRKQIKLLEEAAERLYREWFIELHFPGHKTATFNADGLPEGWNSYKIDDVFSIKYGKNLATTKLLDKAQYPVYGANGVIGRYEKKTHSDYVTLITSRGNGSGDVSRTYDKEAYITNNSFIVEPEKEFVYCGKEYTYYLIKNVYFKGVVSGSAQPQLTNMGISTLSIVIAEKGLIEKFNKITESIFAEIVMLKQQIIQAAAARDLLLPKLMNGEIQL